MEKLKPCPFCGDDGMIAYLSFGEHEGFAPQCQNEACFMSDYDHYFDTEELAVDAWNNRFSQNKLT